MAWTSIVGIGVISLAMLAGCEKKVTCPAPPEKTHSATPEENAAGEAFKKDNALCEELVNPKLTLRSDELTITSVGTRTLMRRADIPGDRLTYLAPIGDALASHRDTLRYVRNEPAKRVDFDVDPKLESIRAINVMAAASRNDWPQMMVKATDGVFMRWWTPAAEAKNRKALYLELVDAQRIIVRKPGGDCATPPVARNVVGAAILAICQENAKQMKVAADSEQTGRCIDDIEMRVPAQMPFGDTAQITALITAILAAQKSAAPIALLVKGMDFEPDGRHLPVAPTEEMKRCAKP